MLPFFFFPSYERVMRLPLVCLSTKAMRFRTSRMREDYRSLHETDADADVAMRMLSERWHAHVRFGVAARALSAWAGGERRARSS